MLAAIAIVLIVIGLIFDLFSRQIKLRIFGNGLLFAAVVLADIFFFVNEMPLLSIVSTLMMVYQSAKFFFIVEVFKKVNRNRRNHGK